MKIVLNLLKYVLYLIIAVAFFALIQKLVSFFVIWMFAKSIVEIIAFAIIGLPIVGYLSVSVLKFTMIILSALNPYGEKSTYPVVVSVYIIGIFSVVWFWKNADINVTRHFVEGITYTSIMIYATFMYSALVFAREDNGLFENRRY